MTFHPLGDSALTVDFTDEYSDRERLLARALSVAEALEEANIPGVIDVTSAYESVAVFFDPVRIEGDVEEKIRALVASAGVRVSRKRRRIEIPVCYDADFALDLARVEVETNLSADTIIALHSSAEFVVACVGFMPGFPFLAGLPEKLRTTRLATPRTKVPAGSVAIARTQAGVYPVESPGGWNLIGRTPLRLFDANANPPALLQAGNRVRFRGITRNEFEARVKESSG
jgi:inhibitor of KinA